MFFGVVAPLKPAGETGPPSAIRFLSASPPKPTIDKLNRDLARIVTTPEVREKFSAQGAEPQTNTPAEFTQFIKTEIVKWVKVIRDAGLQSE